jgi:hypothetical protein
MDTTTLQASIAATKLAITAYEAAQLALATGGVQSYTLDTGQTRQTVTKLDLDGIQKTLDILYNRCATLSARLTGGNVSTGRPAW